MSSDAAIRVTDLAKRYQIGAQSGSYQTFRETVSDVFLAPVKRLRGLVSGQGSAADLRETLWALEGVSFEVQRGEVVGVIGHNGAGKSTLLKILSRITEPTSGRVELRGRVASLLEVGTGFHPELTGRENILLNGSILGLARAEILAKLDKIVGFAEIGRFLDTPVKHYSSGMYVRLAFAVAAHLEPEILLVDEVLSVGDARFQRKCLGKMEDVARSGRTVLFVSHNLQAVQNLCTRAVCLAGGQLLQEGPTVSVVNSYLAGLTDEGSERTWTSDDAPGCPELRLLRVAARGKNLNGSGPIPTGEPVVVEMDFQADESPTTPVCVGFDLLTAEGVVVIRSYQTDQTEERWLAIHSGHNRWSCVIPPGLLNGGTYYVAPRIGFHNVQWLVHLDPVVRFETVLSHGDSPLWNSLSPVSRPGTVSPILEWKESPSACKSSSHEGSLA